MNGMPPPSAAAVASLRERLWDAGFRPVALKTGDKMPTADSWPDRARRNPPADAKDPPASNTLNTGLLADGLRIVDLDVDDTDVARRLRALAESILGGTPCVRSRLNSPRVAMLYRAAEGQPGKRKVTGRRGGVEVLGKGQQLHAYGPHPSGAALVWESPPHETPIDQLPAVTEAHITAFLAAAATVIEAGTALDTPRATAPGGHQASPRGTSADTLDVAVALAAVPNNAVADWDEWNRIGLAIYAATEGSEVGRNAWHAWSCRNPAYDNAATEARWKHYAQHKNRDLPPGKAPIGAGALFDMARKASPGWVKPSEAAKSKPQEVQTPDPELLTNPDMSVLRLGRRPPPALPMYVFGTAWAPWISDAAEAAAAPPDYVALPLLAVASALIGNARWALATEGWFEPPHLWAGAVGDSGSSKSPGADCLLRDVLPVIEQRMMGDFPERLRDWRAAAELKTATNERWKAEVRAAQKAGSPPPLPPAETMEAEPQAPRLRQSDVTIERVATLLATAAPKGLLIVRDELAGWLLGLNSYNDSGRAFWIEAYGGRPYRVERQKHPEPIVIPHLAVAVTGSTQPEKLGAMFREADDGLLSRFMWAWPDPLPFRLGKKAPAVSWAVEALDRLRVLELAPGEQPGDPARPIMVPLAPEAQAVMEAFGQDMQRRQQDAGGLLQSAYGKARGLALRLSLVLTMLRWCGTDGMASLPVETDRDTFIAACDLVADYFIPMAQRVYGDAAATQVERNAATLARWIRREKASEVHVRHLQREVRLSGLGDAETIRAAADLLVEAGWLIPPRVGFGTERKVSYSVNPVVVETEA
jgi:hypothetical protein